MGHGHARGVSSPRGHARVVSLELGYEFGGHTDPVQPPSTPNVIRLVHELLLRVLAKLEGASPTLIILDVSVPTVLVAILQL